MLYADARAGRVEMGAAGAGNATTGNSVTDGLSRMHRMTLDEAKLILNLKNATQAEKEDLIKVGNEPRLEGDKVYVAS